MCPRIQTIMKTRVSVFFDYGSEPNTPRAPLTTTEEKVHNIIALQDFAGFWDVDIDEKLSDIMGRKLNFIAKEDMTVKELEQWITLFVVLWLERDMGREKGVWELVVEKARKWVVESVGSESAAKELEGKVLSVL